MAPRIPRMSDNGRPSAVSRRAVTSESGAEPLFKGLQGLADTGVNLALDSETREAARLRDALEAKTAITNEVSGARMAGDFEETLVGFSEGLKKQYWEQPEKVVEAFIEPARVKADAFQKDSGNSEIALDFSRQSGARIQAITRELHDWVSGRQTQKAKGDLSVLANRASAGAESQSLGTLPTYLAAKEAQLAPLFQKVYGADADAKMNELKNNSARAFLATREDVPSILGAFAALGNTEGGHPLVDNLNGTERESARKDLISAYDGALKRRNFKQMSDGVVQNMDLALAFQGGTLDPGTIWAAKRALETQKNAIEVGLQDEDKLLNGTVAEGRLSANAGFDVKDRKEVLELMNLRLAALDGYREATLKQRPFDAVDDVDAVAAVARTNNKILAKGSPNGKDLKMVLEQQRDIAVLQGEGRLTKATADTYSRSIELSIGKALKNSENVLGPDTWFAKYRDPRSSGNTVLNIELEKRPKLTQAEKNLIRTNYEAQFNDAAGTSKNVDRGGAKNMALRAISLVTHEQIPGVR